MGKVIIKKVWDHISNQTTTDDKGNTWKSSDLVARAKDLPVKEIPMDHLSLSFDIGGMRARKFVGHMKMILDADMSYPIILDEDGCVFDGRHRMARALLEGHTKIKTVRFEEDPPPTYIKEDK